MSSTRRPRADHVTERAAAIVGRIVEDPVRAAVRDAIEEERDADQPGGDAGGAGRLVMLSALALLIVGYVLRRRRPARGPDPGVGTRPEPGGEDIQVEAAAAN